MPNNMKKAGMAYQKGGPTKKKYGMGGPKSSNYVGNPMGYFNDKAMYGKEQMMKAQDGKSINLFEPNLIQIANDLKKAKPLKNTMQTDSSTCSGKSCSIISPINSIPKPSKIIKPKK